MLYLILIVLAIFCLESVNIIIQYRMLCRLESIECIKWENNQKEKIIVTCEICGKEGLMSEIGDDLICQECENHIGEMMEEKDFNIEETD